MNSNQNLPEDIIFDILSRLPAKSIGRSRCVSKPWRAMLSQPKFIRTHLDLSKKLREESLIFTCYSEWDLFSAHLSNAHQVFDEINISATKLNFAYLCRYSASVYGSCDGLLLLCDVRDKIFVVNPLTREIREVPDSPLTISPIMYGFGYDSLNNDYKIVTLSYYPAHGHQIYFTDMFVNVYSLKNNFWKQVESSLDGYAVGNVTLGVFVNGCVHWLARRTTDHKFAIVAFDLVEEKFHIVPFPISVDDENFGFGHLGMLGGCLCVFGNLGTDLWMMKDYGVHESWTKFKIDFLNEALDVKLLCLLGEEVVMVNDEELVIYNLTQGTWKDVMVNAVEDDLVAEMSYIESLVSPYGVNDT